jgi:PmbA protein
MHSVFNTKGYDQLDLIETRTKGKNYSFEAGEGYKLNQFSDFGIGVRAVVKNKVGHAYANRHEDLPKAVKQAIKAAKYSNISIKFGKYSYKKPSKIYDKTLMGKSDSDFLAKLKEIIAATRSEKCKVFSIGNYASEHSVKYLNSEGADLNETSTSNDIFWDLEYKQNPCSYSVESTHFITDFAKELTQTCDFAKLQTKKIKVKTASMPIVFHHSCVPSILSYGLLPAFSAKAVQQGKSKLANKIGKKVFSSKLSIVDDGLLSGGIASSSFDSEGVPCQRTELVKNGVLKGFLSDLARGASTGNGSRSYSSACEVAPSNFVIAKGKKDVVKDVDNGILLYSAMNTHSIDFISGDFSIGASPAFVIRKGELVGMAKKMMLSGNIYKLLSDVRSLGSDAVSSSSGASFVTPSILSKCLVIGE